MASALDKIKAYKDRQTNPLSYLNTSGMSALDKIKQFRKDNPFTTEKEEDEKKSTPVDWNKIKEEQNKVLSTPVNVKNTLIKESKKELPMNYTLPTTSKLPTNYNQNVIEEANKNVTNTKGWKGLDISQIVKVPENFKDGYQFGDITKTIGSTALDLGTSTTKGIFNLGEGIGDLAQYGVAQVGDWLGADDFADQLRKNAQQDVTSMIFSPAENMYGKNSVAGETTTQVAEGVGNVLGMAYGGGILPKPMRTIGKGAFKIPTTSVISGMGGGMTEAYNNGATDREAWLYGLGSGLAEGFSESLFGGLGSKFAKVYGGGALDDVLIKNVTNRITNSTMRTLAQSGLKAVGEGAEEVISGLGSAIAKKLTYLSDEEFSKIVQDENLLEQFVMGTLTSAIMQVPSTVNAVKNGTEYIGELQKNIESGNTQNTPKTVYDLVQQEQKSQNSVNLPILNNNGNIVNSNKFQYVKSGNSKIDNLRKSANQYFNNSVETQNLVNTIEKVISDKNYNVVFDNSIKNKNGQSVNAQITTNKNGEIDIKINPNSPRAGEFLLTHEITHAIETDSMKNLILDYASKNTEFNQALESLKQIYGTDDVSSEVIADISGQLLGNQEFINSLSMEQPSVFKKIYNKIIELANKITGNSKESLFIKDLKNKWEEAYRNTTTERAVSNLNDGTAFSIQTDITGNRYVNVDTDQDIFNGKSLVEQTKIAKQYILDNFRQNGIDFNNENISVTSKTANEYTHPRKQLPVATKSSKMRASTELNNLLSISKYQNSSTDDGRHPFAKDGWDYYETTFKIGDNVFTGLINIGKNGNKKTLYDITNIKRIDQNRSTSANAFTTSLVNSVDNNIPQSNKNVKSDISTNYSMQNQQNNSQRNLVEKISNNILINSEGKMIDISNLKENTTMKMYHYNRKYNKNDIVAYRGESDSTGNNGAFYGLGLYTTLDKNYASNYGTVSINNNKLLPDNPNKFKTQNDL